MIADYHTHTPFCHHAEGEPESYVDAAIAAGLTEYGWRMSMNNLPTYLNWIERARTHAAGRIPIRAGLECDWLPGNEKQIEDLAAFYDWDYLIGSVHYLSPKGQTNWDFDNPAHLSQWEALTETELEDLWMLYWNTYTEMAASGLFDILGHADLIKKFSYSPKGKLDRYYAPAIELIAAKGTTIELNTAGWHKPCAEQYPSDRFLQLAAQAKIPIVISSDAHHPSQVARDFPKAIELAKACGFTQTQLFANRQSTRDTLS